MDDSFSLLLMAFYILLLELVDFYIKQYLFDG